MRFWLVLLAGGPRRKTSAPVLDWQEPTLYAGRGYPAVRESDMTPEERQMLADLFDRVNAAGSTPRDPEAETFINNAARAAPFAPYVLAQTVLVQQRALEAAAQRLADLEAAARQAAQNEEHGSFLGNLGKTIFGGGGPPPPQRPAPAPQQGPGYAPRPPQGYPPAPPPGYGAPTGPAPGPWGQQAAPSRGGGFLANAASTAAGVAGGVALGNLLGGLFGGHSGGLFGGGLGGAGFPGGFGGDPTEVTEINNIYEGSPDQTGTDFQPSGQDVNFDGLDDSSFDGSDDGSFDGGGYDDV
jgi:uncharacterized protein